MQSKGWADDPGCCSPLEYRDFERNHCYRVRAGKYTPLPTRSPPLRPLPIIGSLLPAVANGAVRLSWQYRDGAGDRPIDWKTSCAGQFLTCPPAVPAPKLPNSSNGDCPLASGVCYLPECSSATAATPAPELPLADETIALKRRLSRPTAPISPDRPRRRSQRASMAIPNEAGTVRSGRDLDGRGGWSLTDKLDPFRWQPERNAIASCCSISG